MEAYEIELIRKVTHRLTELVDTYDKGRLVIKAVLTEIRQPPTECCLEEAQMVIYRTIIDAIEAHVS